MQLFMQQPLHLVILLIAHGHQQQSVWLLEQSIMKLHQINYV